MELLRGRTLILDDLAINCEVHRYKDKKTIQFCFTDGDSDWAFYLTPDQFQMLKQLFIDIESDLSK
jgi:hypothetical protein